MRALGRWSKEMEDGVRYHACHGRWRSEETEDGVRCHACHGKVEE